MALLAYYLVGSVVLAAYLWSPRSLLRPSLAHPRLRWSLFKDILRVGLVGMVSTRPPTWPLASPRRWWAALVRRPSPATARHRGSNTCWCRWCSAWAHRWSPWWAPASAQASASAPCGPPGSAPPWRLRWPRRSACGRRRFPRAWLSLFNSDPTMLEAGALYLRTVGPVYGFFGLGLVLYFASQGAGRLVVARNRQHRPAGRGRHRRMAGPALGWRPCGCVRRAGRGAGDVRCGQCLGDCGWCLVRPGGLAAQPRRAAAAPAASMKLSKSGR